MKKQTCDRLKSIALLLCTAAMCVLWFAPLRAQAGSKKEQRTVRVGISNIAHFSEKQEDGSYEGILIDYLQDIAKYAGWNLEYVEDNPDNTYPRLVSGDLDLVGGLVKTDDAERDLDYAEYNSGYSYSTLQVARSDTRYVPMDYSSFNGMRVGVYREGSRLDRVLKSFCETNGISYVPVYYADMKAWQSCLKNGEVDAVLDADINMEKNYKIIAKFGARPYYFAVTKGKQDILRELNAALFQIMEINPSYDSDLYEKYFEKTSYGEFILSEAEKAYVATAKPLRVVMLADWAPIGFYDHDTHQPEGISVDILGKIAEKTGLRFEYIETHSYEEAIGLLEGGSAEIAACIYANAAEETEEKLVPTRDYMNTQIMLVRNSASGAKGVVAVAEGCRDFTELTGGQQELVRYYPTVGDCIRAVASGQAEMTVANSMVVDHYFYLRGNKKISFSPLSVNSALHFAVAKPADSTLLTILDKAIYSMTDEEIQSIVYQHTAEDSQGVSLEYLLYANPVLFLGAVVLGFLLILGVLLLIVRTRVRLSRQIALNNESYRIMNRLTDEYLFVLQLDKGELELPSEFAGLIGVPRVANRESEGLCESVRSLFRLFEGVTAGENVSMEMECTLAAGGREWYRAVGTVLPDDRRRPARAIGKLVSIEAEVRSKRKLEDRANRDALTGLFNKAYCMGVMKRYYEERTAGRHGALLIMDVDHFKDLNDTMGHLAGDVLLKEVAQTLCSQFRAKSILTESRADEIQADGVRGEDLVARWGGDEFVVFLDNVPKSSFMEKRAQAVCREMDREFIYDGASHKVSVSIGIASADDVESAEELFRVADEALYVVKRGSRNGYCISPSTHIRKATP